MRGKKKKKERNSPNIRIQKIRPKGEKRKKSKGKERASLKKKKVVY